MGHKIELVVFDADGVLQDNREKAEYFNKETKKLLDEKGIMIDDAESSIAWKESGEAASKGEISPTEARLKFFRRLGVPESILADYEQIDRESLRLVTASEPGIRENLLQLKKGGYRLAILSNTIYSSYEKSRIMGQIGLSGIFDKIFVANEIKHIKPEKEAYYAVLDYFKLPPTASVFIGHEEAEMEGAKSVGMHTVSYKGYDNVDYVANSFGEIVQYIENYR